MTVLWLIGACNPMQSDALPGLPFPSAFPTGTPAAQLDQIPMAAAHVLLYYKVRASCARPAGININQHGGGLCCGRVRGVWLWHS